MRGLETSRPTIPAPWALLGGLVVLACAPSAPTNPPKPDELATVEVTAAPDAAYSTADDQVERRAAPGEIAGALPDGFPADIPLYRPSSLVDFASGPSGGGRIVLATPAAPAAVRDAMERKLRAAGWQAETGGAWRKSGRVLRLAIEPTAAGSRFRIDF